MFHGRTSGQKGLSILCLPRQTLGSTEWMEWLESDNKMGRRDVSLHRILACNGFVETRTCSKVERSWSSMEKVDMVADGRHSTHFRSKDADEGCAFADRYKVRMNLSSRLQ